MDCLATQGERRRALARHLHWHRRAGDRHAADGCHWQCQGLQRCAAGRQNSANPACLKATNFANPSSNLLEGHELCKPLLPPRLSRLPHKPQPAQPPRAVVCQQALQHAQGVKALRNRVRAGCYFHNNNFNGELGIDAPVRSQGPVAALALCPGVQGIRPPSALQPPRSPQPTHPLPQLPLHERPLPQPRPLRLHPWVGRHGGVVVPGSSTATLSWDQPLAAALMPLPIAGIPTGGLGHQAGCPARHPPCSWFQTASPLQLRVAHSTSPGVEGRQLAEARRPARVKRVKLEPQRGQRVVVVQGKRPRLPQPPLVRHPPAQACACGIGWVGVAACWCRVGPVQSQPTCLHVCTHRARRPMPGARAPPPPPKQAARLPATACAAYASHPRPPDLKGRSLAPGSGHAPGNRGSALDTAPQTSCSCAALRGWGPWPARCCPWLWGCCSWASQHAEQ